MRIYETTNFKILKQAQGDPGAPPGGPGGGPPPLKKKKKRKLHDVESEPMQFDNSSSAIRENTLINPIRR